MIKQKEIRLGFVDLENNKHSNDVGEYAVKSASDISLKRLPYPADSRKKRWT